MPMKHADNQIVHDHTSIVVNNIPLILRMFKFVWIHAGNHFLSHFEDFEAISLPIFEDQWNKCVEFAIQPLAMLLNDNRFYIGGVSAKKVTFEFPKNLVFISIVTGPLYGIGFWKINKSALPFMKEMHSWAISST